MKKNTPAVPYFHLLLAALLFLATYVEVKSQAGYIDRIEAPYPDNPGPYHIRVFVNFMTTSANPWTTAGNYDLQAEANAVITTLNAAYNAHNIYFVPHGEEPCADASYATHVYGGGSVENFHDEDQDETLAKEALHVYVIGDVGDIAGYGFNIPNTFCEIYGKEGGQLVTRTHVLVHEVGHLLGLLHTHAGNGNDPLECNNDNENTILCAGEGEGCNCCGDYVCDTPVNDNSAISDCNTPNIPDVIIENYMSYSGNCRKSFTLEQAKRMRTYLEQSDILRDVQIAPVELSGTLSGGTFGNIIVNSGELEINSMIEMLPGASIWVKPGAILKVKGTITGACGKMWQGVVVEGTQLQQTPAYQGKISLHINGKIEHAKIGIDIGAPNSTGGLNPDTGGGIVTIGNGQLVNNTIGIRFGSYATFSAGGNALPNTSILFYPDFSITDAYRGDVNVRPTFIELSRIVRLHIRNGEFFDLRTSCAQLSRAIGINSMDSGIYLGGCKFKNLHRGIRVNNLQESFGSVSVYGCTFEACLRSIVSLSTSGFSIVENDFELKRPDVCTAPTAPNEIIGAQISGKTTGFRFLRNNFFHDNVLSEEILIGTDFWSTGEGLNNTVFKNSYTSLDIGNRAVGINSGLFDGLLYLCNTNALCNGIFDDKPADFKVLLGGSIKPIQASQGAGGVLRPTGNVFSGTLYTFVNDGMPVTYYYYDAPGAPLENPDGGALGQNGAEGIIKQALNEPNDICNPVVTPQTCEPCPAQVLEVWKEDFYQNRSTWVTKKEGLPLINNPVLLEEEEAAIGRLRLEMNKDGGNILRNYVQDTTVIEVDSILVWLALLETYATDYRLARHYFFTENYTAFDALWPQIETKYDLDPFTELEYRRLDTVFALIRHELLTAGDLSQLSSKAADQLKVTSNTCDEAGYLCQAILWRNGIDFNPECEVEKKRIVQKPAKESVIKPAQLNVYPNPAKTTLTISYAEINQSAQLRLINLRGQVVYQQVLPIHTQQVIIPVNHLSPGIYYAELRQAQAASTARVKIIVLP